MNAFKAKLGSDHVESLNSMSHLAFTYSHQDRLDEAEKLQADVMNAFEAKLGAQHLHTLSSMANLASWGTGKVGYGREAGSGCHECNKNKAWTRPSRYSG